MTAWLTAQALAAEFGPCRVGLLWRNGAPYDQPASVEITAGDETPPDEAEEPVGASLARADWMDDLLSGRYLPRVEPVAQPLTGLDRTDP